jgi:hypothetical protein
MPANKWIKITILTSDGGKTSSGEFLNVEANKEAGVESLLAKSNKSLA